MEGICYIVATPIGNLKDITYRAIETLHNVDHIYAEDTRTTGKLAHHFSISTPIRSLYEHNEIKRIAEITHHMAQGQSVALVSDAGTPLVCDPGSAVVKSLKQKELRVCPVPGPSSLITALSVSGFCANAFHFYGFLPAKSKSRQQTLKKIAETEVTSVCFESVHRLHACIEDMETIFDKNRKIMLAKELTKVNELCMTAQINQLKQKLNQHSTLIKGEFIFVIEGQPPLQSSDVQKDKINNLLTHLLPHLSLKETVKLTTKLTGESKNEIYQKALKFKQQS